MSWPHSVSQGRDASRCRTPPRRPLRWRRRHSGLSGWTWWCPVPEGVEAGQNPSFAYGSVLYEAPTAVETGRAMRLPALMSFR